MALVMPKPETVAPDAWFVLIRRRCGLTFRDTQAPVVLAYVRDQMRASGITSERQYYALLAGEPDGGPESTTLIERLLNHETSFFRHPASYDVLRTHILPELRETRGRGSRLNLWSAGCSTGQETYSLAMLAMDALDDGEASVDFAVWGGDISRRAIEIARRGRYGPRAIAGVPDEYRRRFLRSTGTVDAPAYEVVEPLRQRVRFTAINLVAACGVNLNHDVIFCHNVLIYLSPLAVSQVIALLASRLTLGGYLLLGPGEAPAERPLALEALTIAGVRVLRRRIHAPAEVRSC
jgi:chemotaxis methyl-accepting protein methylase